ncbi:hypothetical protein [Nitrobacter sp.]|uniref:hypothetical protein n=1 Tax=Nitrobacter sp. TaxID=29420 RepID=UPI003F64F134
MADEAFALSPMSASAAPPSAADFDAIREAFMETSRGRWFLTEYAKRNRNADTTMVLDAVARIEQTVAAAQQQAAASDALPKALAAIKVSIAEAKAAAAASFDKRIMDDALAPIEKGVRIIREISWRWREIGGDSRICDILDSQAGAIDAVHEQLAARDDSAALQVVFGLIESTLDELSDSPAATTSPRAETARPPPAADHETVASPDDTAPSEQAPPDAVTAFSSDAESGSHEENASNQEPGVSHDETVRNSSVESENAASSSEAQVDTVDTANTETRCEQPVAAVSEQDAAHDDAVLDMIALEMGAPDFDESETVDAAIGDPVIAEPEQAFESAANSSNASPHEQSATIPEIAEPPSLGASLLESGIVSRAAPRSDPLAPIRRMTQAEKIAFFS